MYFCNLRTLNTSELLIHTRNILVKIKPTFYVNSCKFKSCANLNKVFKTQMSIASLELAICRHWLTLNLKKLAKEE